MYELSSPVKSEIFIKKSKFLAHGFPLDQPQQAQDHLDIIAHHYPSATHHCWAWIFGAQARCSDDGEPSGTAGKPILDVLTRRHTDRLMMIVSRWFGGVKLGAGGLVRAYATSAKEALNDAPLRKIIPQTHLHITTSFEQSGILMARLKYWGIKLEGEPQYNATGISLIVQLPKEDSEILQDKIRSVTHGNVAIHEGHERT